MAPDLFTRSTVLVANHQIANFRHVFHCEHNALSAQTAVLDATVGHVVHSERGHVADDDTANVQFIPGLLGLEQVPGKDACLQSKLAVVDVSQRLVDSPACVVASDQDLAPQLRRMLEASGQTLPESKPILEINVGHPLVTRLSAESDDQRFNDLTNIVLDHALLADGTTLPNPADYVRRMNTLLLDMDSA